MLLARCHCAPHLDSGTSLHYCLRCLVLEWLCFLRMPHPLETQLPVYPRSLYRRQNCSSKIVPNLGRNAHSSLLVEMLCRLSPSRRCRLLPAVLVFVVVAAAVAVAAVAVLVVAAVPLDHTIVAVAADDIGCTLRMLHGSKVPKKLQIAGTSQALPLRKTRLLCGRISSCRPIQVTDFLIESIRMCTAITLRRETRASNFLRTLKLVKLICHRFLLVRFGYVIV